MPRIVDGAGELISCALSISVALIFHMIVRFEPLYVSYIFNHYFHFMCVYRLVASL